MKIYKTAEGILIEHKHSFYLLEDEDWDQFINDDQLFAKTERLLRTVPTAEEGQTYLDQKLQAPIARQEVWASGVTYYNSKLGREEESRQSGADRFYAMVYSADRPELFFKATAHRTAGSGEPVQIRADSVWDVPEPELTLFITTAGNIVGYTIGNDMSSRSIEGDNPLYLPQAKVYDGSAALGPCIYVTKDPLPETTTIAMKIERKGKPVYEDEIAISQIKRDFTELVDYLYRECSFPQGSFLMTGTGIVPAKDFTLQSGDKISITIAPIGTLINSVK